MLFRSKNGTGGDEGRAKRTSGNAGTARDAKGRQVYDDNGKVVDLPKNVDSVAAPGEAAILVQMLGGKGILQGTSKSVAQNDIAQAVFSDENIGKARTYWNGDGSTPMSSSNFARLLAAKPDVCIVSSGMSSFTNAQIKKLKTKKIAYAVLPAMNSAEHIEKATELVGKMLGNRSNRSGGVNAKKLASEFNDYAEDQIASVKGKTNGGSNVYALYLSGWDGKAKFTIPNLSWNETGLAYITLGNSPVREMMKAAGITENASSYPLADGKDYAAIPLNITAESNVSVTNGLELTGRKGKDSLTFNSSRALGQNRFKYVVTNSRATRSHVLSSKDSGNGLWSVYGRVSIASGGSTVSDYGFTKNGRIIRTTIRGNYNVAANRRQIGRASCRERV